MKKILKKFLVYLKALDLFRVYWEGLEYISPELKKVLMLEKQSIIKSRKKFLISKISPMIKPKNWRRPFQSRHDGLNLLDRLNWIDRYLKDIVPELHFTLRARSEFIESGKLDEYNNFIDTLRFEQFYGTFKTQYIATENVFFEVFCSLVLSGINPYNRKVVIMVDGENDRKTPDLENFVGDDVYPIMKTVSSRIFTHVFMNAFEERKCTYRVFLQKLNLH